MFTVISSFFKGVVDKLRALGAPIITVIVLVLVALFEKKRADDANAKVEEADAVKTDATIAQHTTDVEAQQKVLDDLHNQQAGVPVTDEELAKFFDDKLGKK